MRFLLLFFFSFLLVLSSAQGQSRDELERSRKKILTKIDKTNKQLKQTKAQKKESLEEVVALNDQIENRELLLVNLGKEISLAEESISRSQEVISALTEDISRLQAEYARNIRRTWRLRQSQPMLLLVLGSEGLVRSFRRWQYLRQYDRYRKRQASLIAETRKTLQQKIQQVERRSVEKSTYVGNVELQKVELDKEKKEQELQVAKLRDDEKRLADDLNQQKRKQNQLNETIDEMIVAEMRKVREKAQKAQNKPIIKPSKPSNLGSDPIAPPAIEYTPSAEDVAQAGQFAGQRGRMSWPVVGVVTRKFGKHPHPTYKNVITENNGIDISANTGDAIRVVFDGVVSTVKPIPGMGYMVLVRHGNYYSIYTMVENPTVRAGQTISKKQQIGTVGTNNMYQQPIVHLEIWKDKTVLNPQQWLQ
jgi:murein hydrolase activator